MQPFDVSTGDVSIGTAWVEDNRQTRQANAKALRDAAADNAVDPSPVDAISPEPSRQQQQEQGGRDKRGKKIKPPSPISSIGLLIKTSQRWPQVQTLKPATACFNSVIRGPQASIAFRASETPEARLSLPRILLNYLAMNTPLDSPQSPNLNVTSTAADLLVEHRIAEHFVAELAKALHQNGLAADELEQNVMQLAEQLGLEVSVFATPTSIFFSFGDPDHYRTLLLRVTPGDIDLGKLNDLQALQREVVDGRLDLRQGRTQLPLILAKPNPYGFILTTIAFAWASAGSTLLFRGGLNEWLVTLGVGLVLGAAMGMLNRWTRLVRIYVPLSAMFASFVPYAVGQYLQPLSVEIVTLGSLIVLLPGLTVTIAINELATQNLAAGTARLFGAIVLLLTLAFGVAIGGGLGQKLTATPMGVPPAVVSDWMWYAAFLSAPTAFAVLFRANFRDFLFISLTCLMGFAVAQQAATVLSKEVSGAVGSFTVGIIGTLYARQSGRSSSTLVVPGLTFLVPGSIGFRSIQLLLNDDVQSAVRGAFQMFLVAISLVAGLLVAYTFLPSGKQR